MFPFLEYRDNGAAIFFVDELGVFLALERGEQLLNRSFALVTGADCDNVCELLRRFRLLVLGGEDGVLDAAPLASVLPKPSSGTLAPAPANSTRRG